MLRWLIWQIGSAFCRHDFTYEEVYAQNLGSNNDVIKQGDKVSRTCKKCGWHKTYWKYH
jgi:RNase P subunit RPR2